jgi:O-methyltransferase involved in polyketide biosynthesis
MHVQVDGLPHVLDDEVGLRLVGPDDGWRDRPDIDPVFTSGFRASIVARARFIEDLVAAEAVRGGTPYVLPGTGLDTFAQRRPEIASRRASGTPFLSFFAPSDVLALARDAGFQEALHVSLSELADRYFDDRTDGFGPSSGEDLLVATT